MDQEMLPYLGQIEDPDRPGKPIVHFNVDKYPGTIWVDNNCKRVTREDVGGLVASTGLGMRGAPEMKLHIILDTNIRQNLPSPLTWWYGVEPKDWAFFDKAAAEGRYIKKADSIRELAVKMGLNPDALEKTVTAYNGYVDKGTDPDFGRQELKYRLDKAPFYGLTSVPAILISSGGPATNMSMQVVSESGRLIPGLYAVGEITGYRAFGTGGLNTGSIVFGKLAGMSAAREMK